MASWIWTVPGLLICCGLAAGEGPVEVDLKYERYPEGMEPEEIEEAALRPSEPVNLPVSSKAPEGTWKLPKLKSRTPAYVLATLGDEKRLFVLDGAKEKDPFYGVLYFDADGNGDLTDDKPVHATTVVESGLAEFPTIDVKAKVGGKGLAYAFRVALNCTGGVPEEGLSSKEVEENLVFALSPRCSYRGEIRTGGQTYPILLADGNGNGRFDDLASTVKGTKEAADRMAFGGDRLYLTARKGLKEDDRGPLGEFLLLKESLFRVRIAMDRKKLELTPMREGLAPMKTEVPVERIALAAEDGKTVIVTFQPGPGARIPAGRFRIASYQIDRKDPQGDLWSLWAIGTWSTPIVSIDGDAGGSFSLGEPYFASAAIPESAYEQFSKTGVLDSVPLDFRLAGKAQELVYDLKHVEGSKTKIPLSSNKEDHSVEPSFKIAKTTGRIATQGTFGYG